MGETGEFISSPNVATISNLLICSFNQLVNKSPRIATRICSFNSGAMISSTIMIWTPLGVTTGLIISGGLAAKTAAAISGLKSLRLRIP